MRQACLCLKVVVNTTGSNVGVKQVSNKRNMWTNQLNNLLCDSIESHVIFEPESVSFWRPKALSSLQPSLSNWRVNGPGPRLDLRLDSDRCVGIYTRERSMLIQWGASAFENSEKWFSRLTFTVCNFSSWHVPKPTSPPPPPPPRQQDRFWICLSFLFIIWKNISVSWCVRSNSNLRFFTIMPLALTVGELESDHQCVTYSSL